MYAESTLFSQSGSFSANIDVGTGKITKKIASRISGGLRANVRSASGGLAEQCRAAHKKRARVRKSSKRQSPQTRSSYSSLYSRSSYGDNGWW